MNTRPRPLDTPSNLEGDLKIVNNQEGELREIGVICIIILP